MSADHEHKFQTTFSWIYSLAVSVLCCSVLFVIFASYVVDVKADLRDMGRRLDALETRQNTLTSAIETMRRKQVEQPVATTSPSASLTGTQAKPAEPAPVAEPSSAVPTVPALPSADAVPVVPAVPAPVIAPPAPQPAAVPSVPAVPVTP